MKFFAADKEMEEWELRDLGVLDGEYSGDAFKSSPLEVMKELRKMGSDALTEEFVIHAVREGETRVFVTIFPSLIPSLYNV